MPVDNHKLAIVFLPFHSDRQKRRCILTGEWTGPSLTVVMIVLIALSLFCRIDWILVAAVILDHQASVLEWGDGGFFVNQQKRKIRSSLVQIRLSLVAARVQRLGKARKFAAAASVVPPLRARDCRHGETASPKHAPYIFRSGRSMWGRCLPTHAMREIGDADR